MGINVYGEVFDVPRPVTVPHPLLAPLLGELAAIGRLRGRQSSDQSGCQKKERMKITS